MLIMLRNMNWGKISDQQHSLGVPRIQNRTWHLPSRLKEADNIVQKIKQHDIGYKDRL